MNIQNIGILHPGAMGSSVGAAAKGGGGTVCWASKDRSPETAERARMAGFRETEELAELVGGCDLIISVCPPAAAESVAQSVCNRGFTGLYMDANAVSPDVSRRIAAAVESGGASYVDAGLIGPPAWTRGTTRLYLAGKQAEPIAGIFDGSLLEAIVLDGPPGTASALKMTYAAYTKGTAALIGAILAVAQREGVLDVLRNEWSLSIPELAGEAEGRVRRTTAKAWRFQGELEQIAETFGAAGVPDGFHQAAADIYGRLARFKERKDPPPLKEILNALLESE